MLTPLLDLDPAALMHLLRERYGCAIPAAPEFAPFGEDSWCYRSGDFWLSVRRDLLGFQPQAYRSVHQLHAQGLEFILAPLADIAGEVVQRVARYPLIVFPYVACETLEQRPPDPGEINEVITLFERLHATDIDCPLPVEDFVPSYANNLDKALVAAEQRFVSVGPFGYACHTALRVGLPRLKELIAERNALATVCARTMGRPVLTHGEPLPSNILRVGNKLLIGDWGGLAWGPPERDWYHCLRTLGRGGSSRQEFLRLYDLDWILSEVTEYATIFLGPHENDADTRAMWMRLGQYLDLSGIG